MSPFLPLKTVSMCAGRSVRGSRIRWELARLLPEECLNRPVSTLSGGMKRRVAVMRALLTPSRILLMDVTLYRYGRRIKTQCHFIYQGKSRTGGLLILSTHQEEDVELIGGELVKLESCMYDSKKALRPLVLPDRPRSPFTYNFEYDLTSVSSDPGRMVQAHRRQD